MPDVTIANCLFAVFGVLVVWLWRGVGYDIRHLRAVLTSVRVPSRAQPGVELAVVLLVGGLLAAMIVKPQTVQQAIAAGMAWTGIVPQAKGGD